MKKKIKLEWTETQRCSNTFEVEVPENIPADQVKKWIEDNLWDFDPYDGMSVDHSQFGDEGIEMEIVE